MREFQDRDIAVVGLGISGFAAAKFLLSRGAKIYAADEANTSELDQKAATLRELGAKVQLGGFNLERLLKNELIVLSPGIALNHPIVQAAKAAGIPLTTEMELAIQLIPNEKVGVTGTNGKSTVTSMIRHMLNGCGVKAVSCGNIGNPVIGELDPLNSDTVVVMEMSSFQLSRITRFQPKAAVLLNITPDHLDWHGSLEAYTEAKWSIFRDQQANQFAVINENLTSDAVRRGVQSRMISFAANNGTDPNKNAAIAVGKAFGIRAQKAAAILELFKPLEHRMEIVAEAGGHTFINDSKSTNVDSLIWALNRLEGPIVLIAGGRSKDGDFESIANLVERKVTSLIAIGEQKDRLLSAWAKVTRKRTAASMREAVEEALELVPESGTVLLSPGCKSFDMFMNYEDRGRIFKTCVWELLGVPANV